MNKALIPFALLLAAASIHAGEAGDPFEKMGWTKLRPLEAPQAVSKETGSQDPVSLMEIENPETKLSNHLVAGEVRYSDVEGDGYLEMWTVYDDGRRYFSRTLGYAGPMAKMSGTSEWRPFMLPFHGTSGQHPHKLEINALLPGGGSMEFRNLALYEAKNPHGNAWWSPRMGGIIGAILGTTMGLFGTLVGLLRAAGKARGFVCGSLVAGVVAGVACTIAGTFALVVGQPYAVWFTLVLIGVIGGLVAGFNLPQVRKSYIERELRQISAAG